MNIRFRLYSVSGIMSVLLFTSFIMLGSHLRPDYNPVSQTVSELIQREAPNKVVLDLLFALSNLCLAFFGYGSLREARKSSNRYKAYTGSLLVAGGLMGFFLVLLFPADGYDDNLSPAGFMHHFTVLLMTVVAILSIRSSGNGEQNGKFRMYSKVSVLLIFVFSIAGYVSILLGYQMLGLFERIAIASFIQWMLFMALMEFRKSVSRETTHKIKFLNKAVKIYIKKRIR